MKRLRKPAAACEAPRTAAFLDVLFILLITFLLVTTLAADDNEELDERKIEVRLPQLDPPTATAQHGGSNAVQIVLFEDGRFVVDERDLGAGSAGLVALTTALEARRVRDGSFAARIYTDEAARAEHFLPLLALLREQGCEQIDLLGRAAASAQAAHR